MAKDKRISVDRLPMVEGRCPICTRAAESPYRRVVNGAIVEHCLHRCHTGLIGNAAAFVAKGRKSLARFA